MTLTMMDNTTGEIIEFTISREDLWSGYSSIEEWFHDVIENYPNFDQDFFLCTRLSRALFLTRLDRGLHDYPFLGATNRGFTRLSNTCIIVVMCYTYIVRGGHKMSVKQNRRVRSLKVIAPIERKFSYYRESEMAVIDMIEENGLDFFEEHATEAQQATYSRMCEAFDDMYEDYGVTVVTRKYENLFYEL